MNPSTIKRIQTQSSDERRRHLEAQDKEWLESTYAEKRSKYDLANGLKRLRTSWRLSQDKMAELMQVSQRSYSGYENGERSVPSEALIELAVRTDVDFNELLTGEKRRVGPEHNKSIALKTVEILKLIADHYPQFSEEEQLKTLVRFIKRYDPTEGVILSDSDVVRLLVDDEMIRKGEGAP